MTVAQLTDFLLALPTSYGPLRVAVRAGPHLYFPFVVGAPSPHEIRMGDDLLELLCGPPGEPPPPFAAVAPDPTTGRVDVRYPE